MSTLIKSKPLFILSLLVFIYVGIAFIAPILSKNGYTNIANPIYEVYEKFCHQRVERSLFLFGEKSFYSVLELKEDGFLPTSSSSDAYPEYFGHEYNGNDEIGFKVAICIRDIALYLVFAVSLMILSLRNSTSFSWIFVIILVLPIFLDIGVQAVFEILKLQGFYLEYINNLTKRVLTGGLAGIGVALGLSNIIAKSLTNDIKKGDNQK